MNITQGPSSKYFSSSSPIGYGLKNSQGNDIIIREFELPTPSNADSFYSPFYIYSEFADNKITHTGRNIVFNNILPKTTYYVYILDSDKAEKSFVPNIVLKWISGDKIVRYQELGAVEYYIDTNGIRYYLTTIETEETAGFVCLELSVKTGHPAPINTSNISLINANIAGTCLFLNGDETQPLFYQYYTEFKLNKEGNVILKWGDKTVIPNYLYTVSPSDYKNSYWPTTETSTAVSNSVAYRKIFGTSFLYNVSLEDRITVEYYDENNTLRIEALNFKPIYTVVTNSALKRRTSWVKQVPKIKNSLLSSETSPKYVVYENCYYVDEGNNIITCIEKDLLSTKYYNVIPTKISDFILQFPLKLDLGTYARGNVPHLIMPKLSEKDMVISETVGSKGINVYNENKLIDNRNIANVYDNSNSVEYLFPISNFNIDSSFFTTNTENCIIETLNFSTNYLYGGSGITATFGLNGFNNYLDFGDMYATSTESSSGIYTFSLQLDENIDKISNGTAIVFLSPSGVDALDFGTVQTVTSSGSLVSGTFIFDSTPATVESGTRTVLYNTSPEKTLWYSTAPAVYYNAIPDMAGQASSTLVVNNPFPIYSCTSNTSTQTIFIDSDISGGGLPEEDILKLNENELEDQFANKDNYVNILNFNNKLYHADATVVITVPTGVVSTIASGYYTAGYSSTIAEDKAQSDVIGIINKHINIGTLAITKFSDTQVEGSKITDVLPPRYETITR